MCGNSQISQVGAAEAALKNLSTVFSGTFSYLDAGAEQTIFEFTPTGRVKLGGVFLDFNAMTLDGTIRLYLKVDGSTYRQFDDDLFVFGDYPGLLLPLYATIESDLKITYEESADEGAARDIVYRMGYEVRE